MLGVLIVQDVLNQCIVGIQGQCLVCGKHIRIHSAHAAHRIHLHHILHTSALLGKRQHGSNVRIL